MTAQAARLVHDIKCLNGSSTFGIYRGGSKFSVSLFQFPFLHIVMLNPPIDLIYRLLPHVSRLCLVKEQLPGFL
jgi:hypothetical protein